MSYTPDPTLYTQPVDTVDAGTAAAEFRALKGFLQGQSSGNLSIAGTITATGAISTTAVTASTSPTTGALKSAGGLGVAGALWVGTTANVAGATTLQSALTYGGVTLSNAVTGTGNMVLSASPTLTGVLKVDAGALGAATIINGSDVDTGLWFPAANQVGLAADGANVLIAGIHESFGGCVSVLNAIVFAASFTGTSAIYAASASGAISILAGNVETLQVASTGITALGASLFVGDTYTAALKAASANAAVVLGYRNSAGTQRGYTGYPTPSSGSYYIVNAESGNFYIYNNNLLTMTIGTSRDVTFANTLAVTGVVTASAGITVSAGNIGLTSGQTGLILGSFSGRSVTNPTNAVTMYDGTAPSGTMSNGVQFYSASGEARVMDAAGNSTLLSPHDKETNEWIFDSVDSRTGRHLRIDMERMLKFLNDKFGTDFVKDFTP